MRCDALDDGLYKVKMQDGRVVVAPLTAHVEGEEWQSNSSGEMSVFSYRSSSDSSLTSCSELDAGVLDRLVAVEGGSGGVQGSECCPPSHCIGVGVAEPVAAAISAPHAVAPAAINAGEGDALGKERLMRAHDPCLASPPGPPPPSLNCRLKLDVKSERECTSCGGEGGNT
jgi:hypothetical protein